MKRFLSVLISASILLCITGCHTNRGTGDVQGASSSPAESEESLPETSDELSESPNDSDESPEPSVDSDESSEPSDDSSIPAERQMEHSYERSYVLMGSEGNQTEHDVCAGDEITIEVENTSGTIDISIQIDGETLYDKKGIKEESCTLEVDTDGHKSLCGKREHLGCICPIKSVGDFSDKHIVGTFSEFSAVRRA